MARFISGGRSTSFTSTAETSTPILPSGIDDLPQDRVDLVAVGEQLVHPSHQHRP